MSLKIELHHLQLAAPPGGEAAARVFFGELLGLEEVPKPANLVGRGGVWFRCGQHELHIGIEKDFRAAKKAHPAFQVQNLEDLQERLEMNGVTASQDEPLPGVSHLSSIDHWSPNWRVRKG